MISKKLFFYLMIGGLFSMSRSHAMLDSGLTTWQEESALYRKNVADRRLQMELSTWDQLGEMSPELFARIKKILAEKRDAGNDMKQIRETLFKKALFELEAEAHLRLLDALLE